MKNFLILSILCMSRYTKQNSDSIQYFSQDDTTQRLGYVSFQIQEAFTNLVSLTTQDLLLGAMRLG